MIIINAENQIIGRLASYIAKKALLGEKIAVVNSEKAVISGNKQEILEKYKRKINIGIPLKGPYFPKKPEFILKRTIRGMLPYKQEKGRNALENIKCFYGVPEKFQNKKYEDLNFHISKITKTKYLSIYEISKELGAKL
ncbi:MAG: 50S ribosomal protein L13 [Candidatus Woesearchaeota archaeon]